MHWPALTPLPTCQPPCLWARLCSYLQPPSGWGQGRGGGWLGAQLSPITADVFRKLSQGR